MIFSYPEFNLRIRTNWEAADLGLLLWRKNISLLCIFFLVPVILTALILYFIPALFFKDSFAEKNFNFIFFLVTWWLKPFYERFALHICSTIFFTALPSPSAYFTPILKNIFYAIAGDLLWRRFSPLRGVFMPLRVLERLKRRHSKTRKQSLSRGGIHFGAYLTIFCFVLEIVLSISSIIFAYYIGSIFGIWESFGNIFEFKGLWFIIILLYIINLTIVETLYISMSFAVYINSRVITEGWDLQFTFQELFYKSRQRNKLKQNSA